MDDILILWRLMLRSIDYNELYILPLQAKATQIFVRDAFTM